MSDKKEIGLAVVGCGTIGRIRAIMARDYPGVGWIGLCDINKELGHKLLKDCKADFEHYSEKFYKRCATIKAKHFCLIGGCSEIQMDQAKKYNINILEQSVTKWLMPEADFTDNIFDPTVYWLEYQYKCDYFKKAVVQSYDKIQFWNTHTIEFCKKHPTVQSNKKIANRIYEYVTDKLD